MDSACRHDNAPALNVVCNGVAMPPKPLYGPYAIYKVSKHLLPPPHLVPPAPSSHPAHRTGIMAAAICSLSLWSRASRLAWPGSAARSLVSSGSNRARTNNRALCMREREKERGQADRGWQAKRSAGCCCGLRLLLAASTWASWPRTHQRVAVTLRQGSLSPDVASNLLLQLSVLSNMAFANRLSRQTTLIHDNPVESACRRDKPPANGLPLQRKPPSSSDGSSKVAAAPRCEAEADSRCVLVSAAGTPVESACREEQPPDTSVQVLTCFAFATEAAIKLRQIEQGGGCSTVRGGGRLKVRARLCRWHSGAECLPRGAATRHIGAGAYVLCLCNGSCHQAPTD